MDNDKEKQEISLIGRIFSLEALLLIMGVLSVLAGVLYGEMKKVFWGAVIIFAAVLLNIVRKRGWKLWGRGDGGK